MDAWMVIQLLAGAIMAGIGFWVKSVSADLKEVKQQLATTREDYVKKDDLKDLKVEINGRFDKLEDLIEKRIG